MYILFFPGRDLANNNLLFFRQEMMRVREKQKEEEVEALKRSMQSGLVSFCFITVIIAFSLFIV